MKLITLLFLVILTSCGLRVQQVKELSIHSELVPYFKEFQKYYGKNIDDLNMTFANSISSENEGYTTLGYCQWGTRYVHKLDKTLLYQTPKIVINLQEWRKETNENTKMKLIMHEMGHCILKRGHSNRTESLMYPYLNQISGNSWAFWLQDLFAKDTLVAGTNNYNEGWAAQIKIQHAEIIEEDLIIETTDCIHDTGTTVENEEEHHH